MGWWIALLVVVVVIGVLLARWGRVSDDAYDNLDARDGERRRRALSQQSRWIAARHVVDTGSEGPGTDAGPSSTGVTGLRRERRDGRGDRR